MIAKNGTEPGFTIGNGYAIYRGPVTDGSMHRHAAFQIAIATQGEVAILDDTGALHHGTTLLVPPMTNHRLLPSPTLLTYFIEPQHAFADHLRGNRAPGITPADDLRTLQEQDIQKAAPHPPTSLDPRLLAAMTLLSTTRTPMPALAAQVGLSPQRLRALAHRQLGMPLPRWRLWTQLRQAAESLRQGHSLSQAAQSAGFADQPHFTRQMRQMMGLTPSTALKILNPPPTPNNHR
ncbi:AraC family transcriptional regulator [Actinocorallia longicatena]|uniref:HTH araC/xylS-type domain-containing protein n=1 Tax=Actinocorallia longicatena TaxID=111803 RepID=A0ABP6QFD3_9ACTN